MTGNGRWNILFEPVECPAASPVLTLESNVNPFYLSVVVEQTRRAIVSVAVRGSGQPQATTMIRQSFNAFTLSSSTGLVAPLTFTVTDQLGAVQTVVVSAIAPGNTPFTQFPSRCP